MRKTLGTLVIIVIIAACVGFFRGWFDVSAEDQPGETNVELRIDKEKIKQDAETASEKARGLTSRDDEPSDDQPQEAAMEEEPSADEQE